MDLRNDAQAPKAPIAVTGLGAVTPIGVGVERFWDALVEGRCGIGPITSLSDEDLAKLPVRIAGEVPAFDPEGLMGKRLARQTDAFSQYAFVAAEEALGDRTIDAPERVGVVMATAMAGVVPTVEGQTAYLSQEGREGRHHGTSPRFVPRTLGNIAAAHIAIAHGFTGPSLTVSTACASGNDGIVNGARLLLEGACDVVVCVGADCVIAPVVIDSLASAGALSRSNDDPTHACRPFDRDRNGFVIGEGGGAVVLERADDAKAAGRTIYGYISGWAQNNDAHSIISPDPDGVHVMACMRQALENAHCAPEDVDYINAHGTATEAGDVTEATSIAQVFAGCDPWVSSTKGATGHMMAAGGITEVIACLLAMDTGSLPPNINLDHPAFDLRFARVGDRDETLSVALSNAFGFGGQNTVVVLRGAD